MKRFILLFLLALGFSALFAQDGIHPQIRESLNEGENVNPIIVIRNGDHLPQIPDHWSKDQKGRFVYDWLKGRADRMQASLRTYLESEQIPYRPYFLVNIIKVYNIDGSTLEKIAAQDQVRRIIPDPSIRLDQPGEEPNFSFRQNVPWGLLKVHVDSVWDAGYRGAGVVIGGQDTGYDWDHPALIGSYRGMMQDTVIHDYNWHDAIDSINPLHNDSIIDPSNNPCGLQIDTPCDDTNHGTHTMGIMTGRDDSVRIGMAPEAKWMGCRNMERGYGKPSTYLECFEWFLAPTNLDGENPDPTLAPQVINNSWSCPEFEGCIPGVFPLMKQAIDHLVAAGIVVVTSAGNSGPQCGTVSTPPSMFEQSFAVGATMSNDTIAGFSSRGPVVVDSSFRLKPDISAPGHRILSSIPNGNYTKYSGTSMAGPHVAGMVALILQANPDLEGRVQEVEEIIESTAKPLFDTLQCGTYNGQDYPNATYGYGRIDAWAAVQAALDWSVDTDDPKKTVDALRVYPNPAEHQLNFEAPERATIHRLIIYDAMGHRLESLEPSANSMTINAGRWTAGVYFYRVVIDDGWASGTLIIQ